MEYPNVSILTPTFNRNKWLPLMINNLQRLDYPKDKLEWVILDTHDKKDQTWDKLFKSQKEIDELQNLLKIKINYKWNPNSYSIGQKRNMLTKQASHKLLANMDTDDVYIHTWLKHSLSVMKSQKNVGLVGTPQMVFCYPDEDYRLTGITCKPKEMIHESGMLYTKKHWSCMGGFAKKGCGEGASMIKWNDKSCLKTDIQQVLICICHDSNTVNKDHFKDKDIGKVYLGKDIRPIIEKIINS